MGFQEDCERWRAWARSSLGGSEAEVAAAGDAAAVTSLLGGVEAGDLLAAAKTAAEHFTVPDESKERVRDWIAAGLPIQTPADTWRRLFDAGWFAVPLHGLRLEKGVPENEKVIATSTAEHWIWGQAPTKDDVAEKRIRHARTMFGWQGAVAQAALESLDEHARNKGERPANAWHLKDRFQYLLTDQQVLRAVDNKWEVIPFDQLVEIKGVRGDDGEVATRLKFPNNTWVEYRMQNGELQTAVLMRTTQRHRAERTRASMDLLKSKAESTDAGQAAASALELARKLRDAGDLEAAATYFETAAKSPMTQAATSALWDLGSMWSAASQWDRSKDAFNRAIAVSDPKTVPTLLCNVGYVERRAGDYNAALATLQRVIDSDDPNQAARARFLTGALYDEQLHDVQRARPFYNEAISSPSNEWASRAGLYCGRMLLREGELHNAISALHTAVTRSKACRAEAMLELGKLYLQNGRTDIGRGYLEQAAALGSGESQAAARAQLNAVAAASPSPAEPAFSPLHQDSG